jgi:hypothetical protein
MPWLEKNILWVILAVVITGGGLWYWGKSEGTIKPVPLPSDPGQPGAGQLTPEQGAQVRAMSISLHDDMEGANIISRNIQLYKDYANYSDTLFTAVYNDFNTLYFKDNKETLTEWVKNENFWGTDFIEGSTIKEQLLNRFSKLNLK